MRYSVFTSAIDAILTLDHDGRITEFNPAAETMFGRSRADALGRRLFDLILPPSIRARFQHGFERDMASGGSMILGHRVELTGLRGDTEFPMELAITRSDVAPAPIYTAFIRDLTERRRVESELQQSRERFELVSRATNDAVWDWDFAANRLWWSEGVTTLFGRPRAELEPGPSSWYDFIHPHDRERVISGIHAVIDGTGSTWSGEYRFQRADGTFADVFDRGHLIRDPAGKATRMVGAMLDLSDRKRAEAELHSSRERLRHLLTASRAIIYATEVRPPFRITFMASNVTAVLGYEERDFLDDVFGWERRLHPDDALRTLAEMQRIEQAGQLIMEYRMLHKDGHYRWMRDEVTLIRDSRGEPSEIIGCLTDVTEQKVLEERLLHSQKMETVGRLAGGVAHDFNNLLTVIVGHSEMLGSTLDASDPRQEHAKEIMKAAERGAALTRQLLAFSRRQVLQPRVIDLNLVVSRMDTILRRLIGADIELHTTLDRALGSIRADPMQIEQVMMNLVVNARDSMPNGGRLEIITRNVPPAPNGGHAVPVQSGSVELVVSDTGTGMDGGVQAHIFEPFFTTKELGKGTGLGLATVYGIVQQSGGEIQVESAQGSGSRFTIRLPSLGIPQEGVADHASHPAETGATGTILLVEDEDSVRRLARETLERFGYTVLEASSSRAAVEAFRAAGARVDLLVSDVLMPGMSGSALAAQLSALQPDLPVLFISGYADHVLLGRGLSDDAAYLQKPFTPLVFARKVREVLEAATPPIPAAS